MVVNNYRNTICDITRTIAFLLVVKQPVFTLVKIKMKTLGLQLSIFIIEMKTFYITALCCCVNLHRTNIGRNK